MFDRPFGDHEWPDDNDDEGFGDGAETVPCPECGADIYEDAECCPLCGEYLVQRHDVWAGRSPWWLVLGLAGVVAVILTLSLLPMAR